MKTIVLKNAAGTIKVEYLTDLVGNAENFTIYQSKGLDEIAIAAGLDLGVDEYHIADIKALATTNSLSMDIYETGQDVVQVLYYGGAIGEDEL